MYEGEFDSIDDQPSGNNESDPVIDFESDQLDVREDFEEGDETVIPVDEENHMIENAELDNVLDEFVDIINGRDLDGLADLLVADAEAEFVGAMSREDVVDGFGDMFLRNPTLLGTRGDLGSDPIVALWTFDYELDRFDMLGYMTLELSDSEEGSIQRISYVEELSETDDLVVESPDRSDLGEWEDWSELDED